MKNPFLIVYQNIRIRNHAWSIIFSIYSSKNTKFTRDWWILNIIETVLFLPDKCFAKHECLIEKNSRKHKVSVTRNHLPQLDQKNCFYWAMQWICIIQQHSKFIIIANESRKETNHKNFSLLLIVNLNRKSRYNFQSILKMFCICIVFKLKRLSLCYFIA